MKTGIEVIMNVGPNIQLLVGVYMKHMPEGLDLCYLSKNWLALGGAVSSESGRTQMPDHPEYRQEENTVNIIVPVRNGYQRDKYKI